MYKDEVTLEEYNQLKAQLLELKTGEYLEYLDYNLADVNDEIHYLYKNEVITSEQFNELNNMVDELIRR